MEAKYRVNEVVEWMKPESEPIGGLIIGVGYNDSHGQHEYRVALDNPINGDIGEITTWEKYLRKPIASKPTPTPSITVGTQVRLTGVVVKAWPEGGFEVCVDGAPDLRVNIRAKHLEVIRQPFKRGEVVWPINDTISEPWLLVADEEDGKVAAVLEKVRPGHNVVSLDVRNYERRP